MDIKDFEGNFKYKLYLPSVYIFNWILMIIGPFYFPVEYQKYYLIAILYLTFRSSMTFLWTLIGTIKGHRLLNKYERRMRKHLKEEELKEKKEEDQQYKQKLLDNEQRKNKLPEQNKSFCYAFIIPSYMEEDALLQSTLTQISRHEWAETRFLVFLGMQGHQQGSQKQAQRLIEEFKSCFKLMGYTIHKMRQYQQKGKAANVSWCAQHLECDFLLPNKIDPQYVMLTIIDADSWVPSQYIDQLELHIMTHQGQIHKTIFQPCQMFTRNHMEVPVFTRTYDISHGMVQFSNLFSLFNSSFPLSNYSISFSFAKRIGFWDTCPDAIGQDFHTTIKAFWKTRGQVKTVSIFTLFNQINIQTGQGYLTDVSKRFWQAQRHGRGSADASYCLNQFFKYGLTRRIFLICYQVMQITTLPAVMPWCMLGSTAMTIYYLFNPMPKGMIDPYTTNWMFNICTLSFILSFLFYFHLCRRASRLYYNIKNTQNVFIAIVEYILCFLPNLFLITVPTATIGAFRVAFGNNVYEVAAKKTSMFTKQ